MDRRNWPWRKKNKGISAQKASFDTLSNGHVSPTPSRLYDETASIQVEQENARTLEAAMTLKAQAEETVKTLTEQLNVSVGDLTCKEAIVQQHSKIAEEAVSGWEKAETEAISLKQKLEASMQQRSMLEGRVAHLDGALKECMKQVRLAREEQQDKIVEAIDCKTQEWKKVRAELDAIEENLRQRLMESDAQNNAMAKSLHERARTIADSQEAKARAETEVRLLQVKLESLEKEMSALKYELLVLSKELEIRNEEQKHTRKAADVAHKQHLENVKKIAKLESECQRLRALVRKKLPGPAALAQIKMEADAGMRRGMALSEQSSRRKSLGHAGRGSSVSSSWDQHQQQADMRDSTASKHMEAMADRLLAMEEETKILKETLAKRNSELHSARQMCARTANKLSVAEDQLESLQATPTSGSRNGVLERFILQSEAISGSSEKLDDEVSCAESWASALINELAHFKRDKVKQASGQSMDSYGFDAMEGLLEAEKHHDHQAELATSAVHEVVTNAAQKDNNEQDRLQLKHTAEDRRALRTLASKEVQLQSANLMCKDAIMKLASAEARMGDKLTSENPSSDVEEIVNSLLEAHGIMSKLDRVLDEMRIAVASVGDTTDEDSENGITPTINGCQGEPKMYVESRSATVPPYVRGDHPTTPHSSSMVEEATQSAAGAGEGHNAGEPKGVNETRLDGLEYKEQLEQAKTEMQKQLDVTEEELRLTKSEWAEAKVLIGDMEARMLELQSERDKSLADEEAKRGEVQSQFEKAETEVSKLQRSVASLTIELAYQRKEYEGAVAKCEALDKKLQGYVDHREYSNHSCRFEGVEDARARKEREVAAAKEKLAECQRTILVLGKQLTALTSPPAHCQVASFDSSMSTNYGPLDKDGSHHQDHRRAPYSNKRNEPSVRRHVHSSDYLQQAQPHSSPLRIHSDVAYRGSNGVQFSMAEHLRMDDGSSLYIDSPPGSAVSSPSVSPSRDLAGPQRNPNGNAAVRTSLKKSMDRAAAPTANFRHASKRHGSSSFSRFFSRTKK